MIAPVLLNHFESGSRSAADPVRLRWTERKSDNVWYLRVIDKAAKHGSPSAPNVEHAFCVGGVRRFDMIIKFSTLRFCEIIVTVEQRA